MESNLPPENNPPPISPPPPPRNPSPPVIAVQAAPRPPRKGTGWRVFAIILLLLLAVSVVINLRHAAGGLLSGKMGGNHSAGPRLDEVIITDNDSHDKIAVIPVEGVISGQANNQEDYGMVATIKEELRRADDDKQVHAVILKVDSPGGEVLASDDIAREITKFQERTGKPVVVSMGSLAASGGYYVSAPCDWIVANELTITGSIGVIMHGLNYRGLLDKIGVRPEVFKSGKYKDMLSETKTQEEITPEERQMVQSLINETFEKFKSVVGEGRRAAYAGNKKQGKKLSDNWVDFADGRILSGKEAYKLGLVDEIGDFDTAVQRAESLVHIKDANVIEYQPVFDFANLFHLFGQTSAKAVKLDLGVELPKLRPGCMYFLLPTYLQ